MTDTPPVDAQPVEPVTAEEIERMRARDREWGDLQPTDFLPLWSRERLADAYFMACLDRHWLLRCSDPLLTGQLVHAAWRDGMLAQGRSIDPERMSWETLPQQDRDLDKGIAATLDAARAGDGLLREQRAATDAFVEAARGVNDLWDEPDPDTDDAVEGAIWMTIDESEMASALRALRSSLTTIDEMAATLDAARAGEQGLPPLVEKPPHSALDDTLRARRVRDAARRDRQDAER